MTLQHLPDISRVGFTGKEVFELMNKWAKLHVEAALKAVAENLNASQNKEYNEKLRQSILSAYPLTNIK